MGHSWKEYVRLAVRNARGWRTNRKIVVLESDDWGSIRTSNSDAFQKLHRHGFPVNDCVFNKYDSLETVEDVASLAEVLSSVRDKNDRPAVMTMNYIMANPDFEKIKAQKFRDYYFQPFTQTMIQYDGHHRAYDAVMEGIKYQYFKPQFHGREHVRAATWLRDLNAGNKQTIAAFEANMFTSSKGKNSNCTLEYLDAFGGNDDEMDFMIQSCREGLDLFRQFFHYSSKSIIAGCYIWRSELEKYWSEAGIQYIQGGRAQMVPTEHGNGYKKRLHFTGKKNEVDQTYLIRNIFFEPVTNAEMDWLDRVLFEIKMSFLMGKPAIINTHRVNYAGRLHASNRDKHLKLLKTLLVKAVQSWPEIEFMSTDELGDTITLNQPNEN